MSADTAAVVAAALAAVSALAALAASAILGRRVRDLRRLVEQLRGDTVPLVHQARRVVDQAASEMERVGDVLGSAEAVTATVDSASRLAYRAFANPVVAVLAFGSGLVGGLRRLLGRPPRAAGPAAGDPMVRARRAEGRSSGRRAEGRSSGRRADRQRRNLAQDRAS